MKKVGIVIIFCFFCLTACGKTKDQGSEKELKFMKNMMETEQKASRDAKKNIKTVEKTELEKKVKYILDNIQKENDEKQQLQLLYETAYLLNLAQIKEEENPEIKKEPVARLGYYGHEYMVEICTDESSSQLQLDFKEVQKVSEKITKNGIKNSIGKFYKKITEDTKVNSNH